MDQCLALADWKGFSSRRKESKRRGKLRGRAVTPYIEFGGVFNDRMEIRFDPGGMVTIIAGTHSHGQGHATAFAQLVAEWLGVPFRRSITSRAIPRRSRSAAAPSRRGAHWSVATACASPQTRSSPAVSKWPARSWKRRPTILNSTPAHSRWWGPTKKCRSAQVARAFFAPAGPVIKLGLGLDGVGTWSGVPGGAPNYPNGCQVCEVEVDPETGAVHIDRFAADRRSRHGDQSNDLRRPDSRRHRPRRRPGAVREHRL